MQDTKDIQIRINQSFVDDLMGSDTVNTSPQRSTIDSRILETVADKSHSRRLRQVFRQAQTQDAKDELIRQIDNSLNRNRTRIPIAQTRQSRMDEVES